MLLTSLIIASEVLSKACSMCSIALLINLVRDLSPSPYSSGKYPTRARLLTIVLIYRSTEKMPSTLVDFFSLSSVRIMFAGLFPVIRCIGLIRSSNARRQINLSS